MMGEPGGPGGTPGPGRRTHIRPPNSRHGNWPASDGAAPGAVEAFLDANFPPWPQARAMPPQTAAERQKRKKSAKSFFFGC